MPKLDLDRHFKLCSCSSPVYAKVSRQNDFSSSSSASQYHLVGFQSQFSPHSRNRSISFANLLAESQDGNFNRLPSQFKSSIGDAAFPAESGRYHLYGSHACPWFARTTLVRLLKGLDKHIGLDIVHPHMGALGWSFFPPIRGEDGEYPATKGEVGVMGADGIEGVTGDSLYGSKFVRELYFKAQKDYEGRYVRSLYSHTASSTRSLILHCVVDL